MRSIAQSIPGCSVGTGPARPLACIIIFQAYIGVCTVDCWGVNSLSSELLNSTYIVSASCNLHMHTVKISIALLTPVVIVRRLKHWPIFSIKCNADKAVVSVLPIDRVMTCKPSLLQTTTNQWPEQLETQLANSITIAWLGHSHFCEWQYLGNLLSLSMSMEDTLKDLSINFDLDRWPWLSIPRGPALVCC